VGRASRVAPAFLALSFGCAAPATPTTLVPATALASPTAQAPPAPITVVEVPVATASPLPTPSVSPPGPELPLPRTPAPAADPAALLDPGRANARAPDIYRARFATTRGDFVVEVHRDLAPHGADRFYNLVRIGFYDGTRFFRAIDGFMVQWGIPGDPAVAAAWHDATVADDPNKRSNTRGAISFAKTASPDSATTQVYVNYGDNARLAAMHFSPFGEVVTGMSALDALYKGYGETPSQSRIQSEGDAYLNGFPLMDRILRAHVEGE
jgi:peptidyl-prolyl cis-trans isomerase A (cyclophilin A)